MANFHYELSFWFVLKLKNAKNYLQKFSDIWLVSLIQENNDSSNESSDDWARDSTHTRVLIHFRRSESRFRIKPFLNFKMGKDQPKTEKKAAIKQVDEIVEGMYFIFDDRKCSRLKWTTLKYQKRNW